MISVGLSKSEIIPYLEKVTTTCGSRGLVVACINSPKNVTVSGDIDLIETLKVTLERQSIFAQILRINIAYHSPHMDAISREYQGVVGHISRGKQAANTPKMISSVTGAKVSADELTKVDYWVQNMVSVVDFAGALRTVFGHSQKWHRKKLDRSHRDYVRLDSLLEIGPHAGLRGPIRDILGTTDRAQEVSYASVLIRNRSAAESLLKVVGYLHCLGYPVDLIQINNPYPNTEFRTLSNLPEYPFEHSQTYWHEPRLSKNYRFQMLPKLDLLGKQVPDSNPLQARWRHFIKITEQPWVEDHKVRISNLRPPPSNSPI